MSHIISFANANCSLYSSLFIELSMSLISFCFLELIMSLAFGIVHFLILVFVIFLKNDNLPYSDGVISVIAIPFLPALHVLPILCT